MKISVTILVKNGEKYLAQVLGPLQSFDEVVVYDNGSTDRSKEIAAKYKNVRLIEGPFLGFGKTHNLVSSKAKNPWILSIDSDEIVTPELLDELQRLVLDPGTVYAISRKNFFKGKWIRGCGWNPDFQYKLYNRDRTSFTEAFVHESIITKGLHTVNLKNPVLHYPYDSYSDFLGKMQHYAALFANERAGKVKSSSAKAFGHAFFSFFKTYFLKRGFMDGFQGFFISSYNAQTAFYKYLLLKEANEKASMTGRER